MPGSSRNPGYIALKDAARNRWLSFSRPSSIIQAFQAADVLPALVEIERCVQQRDLFAAGFISYEAAPGFDRALQVRAMEGFPLLWFGLYNAPQNFDLPLPDQNIFLSWSPIIQPDEYVRSIYSIKDLIAQGWTYQVNYTIRLRAAFTGNPWALFLQLANAQQADYSAYIDTGDFVICSASPELFFTRQGRELISQPMKGTAPRGRTLAEDQAQAEWLRTSEKNRAENVMIVDMVRNDMGRIAETGSVSVPQLFQVIRFPTVWQMISTVRSRTDAPFSEIMKAMFPCASITGAPKASTMRIISDLETTPRRIYTGSIGFLAPGNRAQLNVAIRTVVVDLREGQAEYGVGGGIVWDSDPHDEYQECMIKARVLNTPPQVFSLLETCLWSPRGGIFLWDYHLKRVQQSAQYFGFALNLASLQQKLAELTGCLPHEDHRVRILVDRHGKSSIDATPFSQGDPAQPVRLKLADKPIDSSNPFLYHKTTNRKVYEEALASQSRDNPGAPADFNDILMWNEQHEITETTIANLVYRIGEGTFTPPISSGLLPGVFRAYLLDHGMIQERILLLDDLSNCDELFVINSVRLWRKAVFI